MKRETKESGMETCPAEGVMKEEKFPNTRKLSHWRVCGEFWNLSGQHNHEEKNKKYPQNMRLTSTASREVAQRLASATSKWGLDREAWVECLG